MNKQTYKLLDFLLKNHSASISQLAEIFGVSERTIRNYCMAISEFLIKSKLPNYLQIKNNMVSLDCDEEVKKTILNNIDTDDYYEYKLSSEERQFIIALSLLIADDYITINDFENKLLSSRVTIYKDIKKVETDFKNHDLFFVENKHKGYLLNTSEQKKRIAIYNLIKKQNLSVTDILEKAEQDISACFINNNLDLKIYSQHVETALFLVEQHCKLKFSDYDFYDTVLFLSITLSRMKSAHFIMEPIKIKENKTIQKMINTLTGLIYDADVENSVYLVNEKHFLYDFFNGVNIQKDINDSIHQDALNYYIIAKGFLYKLSTSYHLDFLKDYKLQEFLTAHIIEMHKRIINHEKIENNYRDSFIKKYQKEFQILENCIGVLEETLHVQIDVDERVYILMHIVAAIHRIENNTIQPRVIVCCHTGFSTSQFLAESLKKNFNVNIVGFRSGHELKCIFNDEIHSLKDKCDLVVSTISLLSLPVPYIQVNPILSEQDFKMIQRMLEKIRPSLPQKENDDLEVSAMTNTIMDNNSDSDSTIIQNFSKIIDLDCILIDKECDDWKQAIITACEPLLWKNIISADYIQAIVRNVLKNGPYFVLAPKVALAHANYNEGVNRYGISFTRLKKGVCFGHKTNDPVSLIIVLAINKPAQQMKMLFNVLTSMCDERVVYELENAKDTKEIYDILKRCDQGSKISQENNLDGK